MRTYPIKMARIERCCKNDRCRAYAFGSGMRISGRHFPVMLSTAQNGLNKKQPPTI